MKSIGELNEEQRLAQNAEYQQMLALVGRALSNWVGIERQLTQTFHYAITNGDRADVVRLRDLHDQVLAKAVNFRNRLDMVDVAVLGRLKHLPHPGLEAEWKGLVRRVGGLSAKRNKLAHRQVVVVVDRGFTPQFAGDLAVRLADPSHGFDSNDPDYITNCLRDGLTTRQIEEMVQDFPKVAYDIQEHGKALLDHLIPRTPPSGLTPPPDPSDQTPH